MKVALAQIEPHGGDFGATLAKHLSYIEEAGARGAGLIVFPELSLTGDDASRDGPDAALSASAAALQPFLAHSATIDIVVGLKERDEATSACYNSAFYYARGRLVHRHRKLFLLDYGVWNEGQHLEPGEQLEVVKTELGRLSVLICNDVWHAPAPYLAALDGAEMLIVPANSARGTLAERVDIAATWEQMNRAYAATMGFYYVFVNRVGLMGYGPHEHRYWGGSEMIGPDGRVVVKAPYDVEALVIGEIDLAAVAEQRRRAPLIRDSRPKLFQALFARVAQKQTGLDSRQGEAA